MDLKFWKEETATEEDFEDFYHLNNITIPDDVPFTWCNTVGSLDGIIDFREENTSSKEIALHSRIDWELLNYGWSKAEAIIVSVLEKIPPIGKKYRKNTLQYPHSFGEKQFEYPLHVYLTGSGKNATNAQSIFLPEVPSVIFTTPNGHDFLKHHLISHEFDNGIEFLNSKNTVVIKLENATPESLPTVDPRTVFEILRQDFNVKTLEITAGGRTIYHFMYHKLIHELRYTIASHFVGNLNSKNEERVIFFPTPKTGHEAPNHYSFQPTTTPRFSFDRLRIVDNTHIILRSKLTYRHEN